MAVVAFQRSGDAAIARAKYNGKIVDGREFLEEKKKYSSFFGTFQFLLLIYICGVILSGRTLKVEVILDDEKRLPSAPAAAAAAPSLLERLGSEPSGTTNSYSNDLSSITVVEPAAR